MNLPFTEQLMAEPLLPDLEPYVEHDPSLGPILRHPLVYAVPLMLPGFANKQFIYKQEALALAKAEANWSQYIYLHERPHRIHAFDAIKRALSNDEYWELLGGIWKDTENPWQNKERWRNLLKSTRPGRERFMPPEDRLRLAEMPPVITVYRGGTLPLKILKHGFSWTLSLDVARWFARRFNRDGVILAGEVRLSKVFAYLPARNEEEILLLAPSRILKKLRTVE